MTGPSATDVPDREEALALEGDTVHVEHFLARGKTAGLVVFVHGFAVHAGPYRRLAGELAAQGFAVTLFDCHGHGRSTGRRGHVSAFARYVSELGKVIAASRAITSEGPLTLMGHSHGGTIVLDAVLGGGLPVTPERLVLVTPFLDLTMPVPWWKRAAAPVFTKLWPTLTMPNGIRSADVTRNRDYVAIRDQDPLVHHVASARWFSETRAAQARIVAAAKTLRTPTLMLVAGNDLIVSSEASLAFAREAGPTVAVRRYEGLYHELFLEPERDQVVADILSWLRAPVAAGEDLGRAPVAVPGII